MELLTILRFVHDHNDKVIGTLVALVLATSIVLLIRSMGDKQNDLSDEGGGLDLKSIEGAMQRVLATQPVSIAVGHGGAIGAVESGAKAAGGGASSAGSGDVAAKAAQIIAERDVQITELSNEIEKLRVEVSNSAQASLDGQVAGGKSTELQAKLEELQARLAEYEIIEDDIADLSFFKEDNARLKSEVDALKNQLVAGGSGGPATTPGAEVPQAPKTDQSGAVDLKFEKSDKFELDPNDDVMRQFAAAVDSEAAPVPSANFIVPPDSVDQGQSIGASSSALEALVSDSNEASIDSLIGENHDPVADALNEMESALPPSSSQVHTIDPTIDPQGAIDALLAEAEADVKASGEVEIGLAPKPSHVDETETVISQEDPLAGSLDTEKMLSEVESLDHSVTEDSLSETIDTDKLMAEAGGFSGELEAGDDSAVDDLLSEFKDEGKG